MGYYSTGFGWRARTARGGRHNSMDAAAQQLAAGGTSANIPDPVQSLAHRQ